MAKRMRDSEGHRKEALQAAGELIGETGISTVTHRKVVERARVLFGLITQYFKFLIDMLAEAPTGLEEEREEKLTELNEVNDLTGLVVDMVMGSLADLEQTRNETSFALSYAIHPKLRRFIVLGDAVLVERLLRNIPEATGRAMLAYCYGVLLQAVAQDTVAPREEIEEALRRLIGDSAGRGGPRKTRVPRSVGTLERDTPGRVAVVAAPA